MTCLLRTKGVCVGWETNRKYKSNFLENVEKTLNNLFPNFQEMKGGGE